MAIDIRLYPGQASPNDVTLPLAGDLADGSTSGDSDASGGLLAQLGAASSGNTTATSSAALQIAGSASGGSGGSAATEEIEGGVGVGNSAGTAAPELQVGASASGSTSASGAPMVDAAGAASGNSDASVATEARIGGVASGGSNASGTAHDAIAGTGSGSSAAAGTGGLELAGVASGGSNAVGETEETIGGVAVGDSDAVGLSVVDASGIGSGNSDASGTVPPPAPPPVNRSIGDGVSHPSTSYWERFHRANERAIAERLALLAETVPVIPTLPLQLAGRADSGSDASGSARISLSANARRIRYERPRVNAIGSPRLALPSSDASGGSDASGDLVSREPIDDLELMASLLAFAGAGDDYGDSF